MMTTRTSGNGTAQGHKDKINQLRAAQVQKDRRRRWWGPYRLDRRNGRCNRDHRRHDAQLTAGDLRHDPGRP